MDASSERWHTITPSEYPHERAALEYVRAFLPDTAPYQAWSNFTFMSKQGHVREVDLLVATPAGLHMVEIKSLHGTLRNRNGTWVLDGKRTMDHPVWLTDRKAKELRELLNREVAKKKRKLKIPWISADVFLSEDSLDCRLDEVQRNHVYGCGTQGLPHIEELLLADANGKVDTEALRVMHPLLEAVSVHPSESSRKVDQWELEFPAFDSGPTWQDHHAYRQDVEKAYARMRVHPYGRADDTDNNTSIDEGAKREYRMLQGIQHPNLLVPVDLQQHGMGPILRFLQDPQAMRLDHYLATYGEQLPLETRTEMIRQLADALHHAHQAGLVHRALAPRAVLVEPTPRGREKDWLDPKMRVGEWQLASRGLAGSDPRERIAPTTHAARHVDPAAAPYLAPESDNQPDGTVSLDVFGLGATAYLVLTGSRPSPDRTSLLTRLEEETCLRPSTLVDGIADGLDELVAAATQVNVADRTVDAEDFRDKLTAVIEDMRVDAASEDPWEAAEGAVIDGTWTVEKRLGTGSSARALLVQDGTWSPLVLKIGRNEDSEERLRAEAGALRGLKHDGIAYLLRDLQPLGTSHYAIGLEFAGDETLAHRLRRQELYFDELQRFGNQLLEALEYLEKHGVWHRDVKPANLAIRSEHKQAARLVLFDFSLALVPPDETTAGTRGYLDPFLGTPRRSTYDWHAERYAAAVTLHEMASTERPRWGDGTSDPRFDHECDLVLSTELFDSAHRDQLAEFFRRALHRDTKHRFNSAAEMRRRFNAVFDTVDEDLPATVSTSDSEEPQELRDEAADRARRDTPLGAAGLRPRAVDAAHRLGANTVGELIDLNLGDVLTARGLRKNTREDLKRRIRQWRNALGKSDPALTSSRRGSFGEDAEGGPEDGRHALPPDLREIAQRLIPSSSKKGTRKAEVARLVLGLPSEDDVLPERRWPTQSDVARQLGLAQPNIAIKLKERRQAWRDERVVIELRRELIGLLRQLQRVATVGELAGLLVYSRGVLDIDDSERRRAYGHAAVRAVVEAEELAEEPAFVLRRNKEQMVVALEVADDEPLETVTAQQLLEMAVTIGETAYKLAHQELMPTPTTVVRELREQALDKAGYVFEEQRLVRLAAAVAGKSVHVNARNELYPSDMELVRALRIARVGAALPPRGHDRAALARRLDGRFPGFGARLPDGQRLRDLLQQAQFPVEWDGSSIVPATSGRDTSLSRSGGTSTSGSGRGTASADVEARLTEVVSRGGVRVLTTDVGHWRAARRRLTEVVPASVVDVNGAFASTLREVMREVDITRPEVVTAADTADPSSKDASNLRRLLAMVFDRLEREWLSEPVLVLDSDAPLSRYDGGRALLHHLVDEVRYSSRGAALRTLILLVPAQDHRAKPRELTLVSPDEQIVLSSRDWTPTTTAAVAS